MSEQRRPHPRSELDDERRHEVIVLLADRLPARNKHPLLVSISSWAGRCLADRAMRLADLQLGLEQVELRRPSRANARDIVGRIGQNLWPAETGVLDRCCRGENGDSPADEELTAMTHALAFQTCAHVVRELALSRFQLDPFSDSRAEDLIMQMYLRCLPVDGKRPSLLVGLRDGEKVRKNQRRGYFTTYTPDSSFFAYLAACFKENELGEPFLRSLGLDRVSRSDQSWAALADIPYPQEDPADAVYLRQVAESVGQPPEHVLVHLGHGSKACRRCGPAQAWLLEARQHLAHLQLPEPGPHAESHPTIPGDCERHG
jgi:hypothetical protein